MKTIIGFENEEIAVSGFGEWVGKDYIDYKFEYKNNQKVIKELFKENQKLEKQLEKKENQQKEFIEYLKDKEKQFDIMGDPINSGACLGILRKYKEIIGGKE